MMIVPTWIKRTPRSGVAAGFALLVVLAAASLAVAAFEPLGTLRPWPTRPEDVAARVHRNVRLRAWLELAVIVLQVAGVAAFSLSRLLPATRWADRGRLAFVAAMMGLGGAGTLCAWYGSEFALFAGGTMAVLLNAVILGSAGARPAPARSCEPFMTV